MEDNIKHKVKVTVIDKKLYKDLQKEYCIDENAGACPFYNVGDEFVFERSETKDDFASIGLNTLTKTSANPDNIAGGKNIPHCLGAWDGIACFIDKGLKGETLIKDWMKQDNTMIACCTDGVRPVIFKIERIDEE